MKQALHIHICHITFTLTYYGVPHLISFLNITVNLFL